MVPFGTAEEAISLRCTFYNWVLVLFIAQRNEGSGTIAIDPLPSESRERRGRYPAPWGGSGGEASTFQGLPWGCDTFHCRFGSRSLYLEIHNG